MTYVVTDACINCKYMDCVTVCPVDCFREGDNMLVIDPDICIDCGVCVPECPPAAIQPDTEPDMERWVAFNRTYANLWPVITAKGVPPKDAEAWKDVEDKMSYFNLAPGDGLGAGSVSAKPPQDTTSG
ncbi:MAG: ferredoxin FdxA, partial [Alphaproteobacteria bacterium]